MNGSEVFPDRYEWKGVLHLHSHFSDGGVDFHEIVDAGESAGLDFILLTDHHTIRPKRAGLENWYGSVLLIIGEELGRNQGHFAAVGALREMGEHKQGLDSLARKAQEKGAHVFITHPDGKGNPLLGLTDHRWKTRNPGGIRALEVWSFMHDWVAHTPPWKLPWNVFRPAPVSRGPSEDALHLWDAMGKDGPVAGLGGLDGHTASFLGLKLFPFKTLFRTIRTHVLAPPPLGNPIRDRDAVLEALFSGNGHIANDSLADSTGFRFWLRDGEGNHLPGASVPVTQDSVLTIEVPQHASLRLIRDSKVVQESEGEKLQFQVHEKGVYRVEARLQRRMWIISNGFYFQG